MFFLSFLHTKSSKADKAKASLKAKLQKMLDDLAWAQRPFAIEKIVDFFNYMEVAAQGISEKELEVSPERLKRAIANSGRDAYGWFRAPDGHRATNANTYIAPTGHFDESFMTHTVEFLLTHSDQPSDQGGFASRPMTTREFYYEAFVKPFIRDKVTAIEHSLEKL